MMMMTGNSNPILHRVGFVVYLISGGLKKFMCITVQTHFLTLSPISFPEP